MNNIEEIINAMEDLIDNATKLPLTGGKTIVDQEQLLDFIEDLRTAMPEEMKRARQIMLQKDDVISRARSEAESIIAAANMQAQKMVSSQEIYRLAQQKANEVITDAQTKSNEMVNYALNYCDNLLVKTEESISATYGDMKASVDALNETRRNLRKKA